MLFGTTQQTGEFLLQSVSAGCSQEAGVPSVCLRTSGERRLVADAGDQ